MDLQYFGKISGKVIPVKIWLKLTHKALPSGLSLFILNGLDSSRVFCYWGRIIVVKLIQACLRSASQVRGFMFTLLAVAMVSITFGCTTLSVQHGPPLNSRSQWVLLPVANNSESPQAGKKIEAILATLLRARGVNNLGLYPPLEQTGAFPVLDEQQHYERTLAWARHQGFRYGITGSVDEWRYKSGVEREPAVGLSLRVVDMASGDVFWSASGARSGWGREPLSGTAQKLLTKMLAAIEFGSIAKLD
jgi:hypothetical protein